MSGIAIHNLNDMAAIAACYQAVRRLLKPGGCFLDYDHFDRVGGVPLHQYTLKVAGFARGQERHPRHDDRERVAEAPRQPLHHPLEDDETAILPQLS